MFRPKLFRLGQLAVALFALSCAENQTPTAPPVAETVVAPPLPDSSGAGYEGGEWIPVTPSPGSGGKSVKGIRWSPSRTLEELSVSGMIGPDGGILTLPGSDFILYFSKGAVESLTLITVTSKESPWVSYDMQPHGLVFKKPVYVLQAISNTTAYETPEAFELIGAYLAPGKEAIAPDNTATAAETAQSFVFLNRSGVPTWSMWVLKHFSRYILASG